MKIAIVSDNGTTISRHFGRASLYIIVTAEEGQEIAREIRAKSDYQGQHDDGAAQGQQDAHGHADPRHDAILTAISDCQVVIAGGMGAGMDQRLRGAGITPIRTRIPGVDLALEKFLAGRLNDMIDLVH